MVEKKADFVIITALEEERDAVINKIKRMPNYRRLPPSSDTIRNYYQADLPVTFSDGTTGFYKVAVLSLLGMGRVQAAAATAEAIRDWNPRHVVLVGIAGGVAARGVRPGDILCADQIVDYELQKLNQTGPQIRWEVYRSDARLLDAFKNYTQTNWHNILKVKRPDSSKPKFHIGPIASGDKVIAFSEILSKYREIWPKLIGVEMEAAGVAAVAFQSTKQIGFFMLRGVSDLADEEKGTPEVEKWRAYACDVAASLAISFLKSGPIPLETSE